MSLDDIFLLLSSFASGGLVIFGGYWESKDKRRRFYRLSPRQIVFMGGVLTIIVSILNTLKTNSDSKKLESSLASNILLTHRIDSATVENNKLVKLIADLAQLNYGLSDKIEKQSEKNLFKADILLHRAEALAVKTQSIIDNSTGGDAFCAIDFIPVKDTNIASRHIVNLGTHPLRNLTIWALQKEQNWSRYSTNTVLDYIKTVGTLYPGQFFKTPEVDTEVMFVNMAENLAGFNLVPDKISRVENNIREYYFMADNGFWYEKFELYRIGVKWYKHIVVLKNNKKIYDKKYVF